MKLPPLNAEVTRKTYRGAKADTYDRDRVRESKWQRENDAVKEFLLSGGGGVGSMTLLDIPVGTGRFLKLYRELGIKAIGMDVSEDMMRQARVKDPEADIRYGDIFDIPLQDNSVEVAVCIRLLNLITEDEMVRAVKELGRVARDAIIVSIRTGSECHRKRRSWTHREGVWQEVVSGIGMHVVAERAAKGRDYRVVLLERWKNEVG